jgi:hypothetical protein
MNFFNCQSAIPGSLLIQGAAFFWSSTALEVNIGSTPGACWDVQLRRILETNFKDIETASRLAHGR